MLRFTDYTPKYLCTWRYTVLESQVGKNNIFSDRIKVFAIKRGKAADHLVGENPEGPPVCRVTVGPLLVYLWSNVVRS